jgi:Kinesin motor domain
MEELRDLLLSATSSGSVSNLDIREDANGNIVVPGLTEVAVSNTEEALSWLAQVKLLKLYFNVQDTHFIY